MTGIDFIPIMPLPNASHPRNIPCYKGCNTLSLFYILVLNIKQISLTL